ncbi:MAG: bL27 family ribosomal protein, partial [Chlorobiales bacterium]|nr:bL27 family ribosomal protein [Chlorobiales bacterium]
SSRNGRDSESKRLGVKRYIHANKASRKKAQLTKIFNNYEPKAN